MRRILLAALLAGCGSDDASGGGDACDPTVEACALTHSFASRTVGAGEEEETLCQSWTMHNATELWVNAVELDAGPAFHHSNWFYVPDTEYQMPDGFWTCADAGWSEVIAALLGGYLFAQSTQAEQDTQTFAPGAAIRIPPYSRVVAAVHFLNAAETPVETNTTLTIRSIPPDQVQTKLTPFQFRYHDLKIPGESASSFSGDCDIATQYQNQIGEPIQFRLFHLLVHYHSLGTAGRMRVNGGPMDGAYLLDAAATGDGDTLNFQFDPPIDVPDFSGFTFTCAYDNPRMEEVGWGVGDQEMCVIAGFAETKMAFDADVPRDTGMVVGTQDGVVENTGPCSVTGFPWYFDRQGGVGP